MSNLIVVTDLDGTLLDHHTYSHAAALPALRELARRQVPLVLNSSKTAAEMLTLRSELGNREPFVVENGGGILAERPDDSLEKIALGMNRADILQVLRDLRETEGYRFTGFADMSVEDLCRHTGLSRAAAAKALERDFSEPLLWQDGEERFTAFRERLRARGLSLTRGGRFSHAAAPVDKGMALRWLRRRYERDGQAPLIVALGDGENDRAMLEAADYPVVVRSPVNPPPAVRHDRLRLTSEQGPAGWNEAVMALLEELQDGPSG